MRNPETNPSRTRTVAAGAPERGKHMTTGAAGSDRSWQGGLARLVAPQGLNAGAILLMCWLGLVSFVHLANAALGLVSGPVSRLAVLGIAFVLLVVSVVLAAVGGALLLRLGGAITRQASRTRAAVDEPAWGERIALFLCALLPLLVWWVAYLPGNFSNDSMDQLNEVLTGTFTDWHPTVHTFLAFSFPLTLTGGSLWSIVLFQMIEEALALTYAALTIRRFAPRWCAFTFVLFLTLNPMFCASSTFPWKDVAFTMAALVLTCQVVRALLSKGMWLKRPANLVAFVLAGALCCLLRHNAILYAAPLLLVTFVLVRDARRLLAAAMAATLALVVLVRGPLYAALSVESPGQRSIETFGMPLSALGGVMQDNPEALGAGRDALLATAPQTVWDGFVAEGGFNSIKWAEGMDLDVLDRQGAGLVTMSLAALGSAPTSALRSPLKLLAMVHLPAEAVFWGNTMANDMGTVHIGPYGLRFLCESLLKASETGLLSLPLWHVGFIELVLVMLVAATWRSGWGLFALSLFSYNVLTSLLLTGPDFRFFLLAFPIGCLLVLFFLRAGDKDGIPLRNP